MGQKSLPVSIRISPQDAEFIAALSIDDAVTPSEKIRAIIKEAREQREGSGDPSGGVGVGRRIVDSLLIRIKEVELETQQHSELMAFFGDWSLDFLAYAGHIVGSAKFDLPAIERHVAERILRLAITIARLGILPDAPCYDPKVVRELLPNLVEVIRIIQDLQDKEAG